MNKYQEALNKAYELISDLDFSSQLKCAEQLKIIQKLVDKETPKKVLNKHKEYCFPSAYRLSGICPNCKNHVDESKYCSRCGQKLDWSGEDEL